MPAETATWLTKAFVAVACVLMGSRSALHVGGAGTVKVAFAAFFFASSLTATVSAYELQHSPDEPSDWKSASDVLAVISGSCCILIAACLCHGLERHGLVLPSALSQVRRLPVQLMLACATVGELLLAASPISSQVFLLCPVGITLWYVSAQRFRTPQQRHSGRMRARGN
jgi:hypothetical protein